MLTFQHINEMWGVLTKQGLKKKEHIYKQRLEIHTQKCRIWLVKLITTQPTDVTLELVAIECH